MRDRRASGVPSGYDRAMRVPRVMVVLLLMGSVASADPAATFHDKKAKALADGLTNDLEHTIGVGADEIMDGGYRGKIHLVPELPEGKYRQQLVWVDKALRSIDDFFTTFAKKPTYRWRKLDLKFVRSVGKRTPSAYATGWTITHNVVGSLLTSERGVRETYFHELFHLNDFDHHDWSSKTLTSDYDAIVKKCGAVGAKAVKCLAPFAPNDTKVRASGTYYAFQPNNGDAVHEYAAELAVRYFKEQSEMAANGKLAHAAFKCGPPENGRAWKGLVDEFFGGQDLVPSCAE
jgi:hypothetical protein